MMTASSRLLDPPPKHMTGEYLGVTAVARDVLDGEKLRISGLGRIG